MRYTPVRAILWVFINTRLLLIFITYISFILFNAPKYSNTPVDIFALLTSWNHEEVTGYLRIAQYGYHRFVDFSFFPLFPWLIASLSHFLGNWSYLLVGTLISNASLLGVLLITYNLIIDTVEDDIAQRTLLYLCIFPTAFAFFISYNTAFYLLLVTGTFLAIQRQIWWVAGFVGLLATLTRLDGIFLVIPYVHEVWIQRRHSGLHIRALAPVLLLPLGTTLYAIYCWQTLGDPLAFAKASGSWSHSLIWPWQDLWQTISELFWSHPQPLDAVTQAYILLNLSMTLGFTCLLILGWHKIRISYSIWQCCLLLFMFETLSIDKTSSLLSNQYFVLTLFPSFITLSHFSKQYPRFHYILMLILPTMQAVLGTVFLLNR